MSTLNVSLPDQLKSWITQQVNTGRYSSASDYLRDLIREDIRHQEHGVQWLADHLKPLIETPDEKFVSLSAEDVKKRARRKIKD
jgi:antitoxin ParD1/3/4